MKSKNERLSMIWNLVNEHSPDSQEKLLNLLKYNGFYVTQATLSRDIKQLKIIKSPDVEGNYIYTTTAPNIYSTRFANKKPRNGFFLSGFLSLEFSGNLVVIKTRPGYAMGIASEIDQSIPQVILGTIAGDDTILLIPREGIAREKVKEALEYLILAEKS
jgi:transcriptional regulator of arginine metabolism